jgi:glycosyltransferase involved in cell wall biosynthesis
MTRTAAVKILQLGGPMGLYGAERWILALIRNTFRPHIEFTVGAIKDSPGGEPPLCLAAHSMGFATQVFEGFGRLSIRAIGQIRRFVVANRIDVIHTHGYKSDVIAAIAARGTPCRIVSTPHGWSTRAGLKLRAYEALDRLVLGFFDAVAPLSRELYDGLARIPWIQRKLTFIPNAVDLAEIDSTPSLAPLVARSKAAGHRVVGFVGQLIPRKRLGTLIRAVAQLPEDIALFIVGDGPQRAELEHFTAQIGVANRVTFLGFRDDRLALMRGFDVFVLPSELEGIPRCLMESMALGTPVVATTIPGCRSLIEPGTTGELFEVGDVEGLRSAIDRLLSDQERRQRIAANAREYIRKEFSAAAMSERYADLYFRLCDKPSN